MAYLLTVDWAPIDEALIGLPQDWVEWLHNTLHYLLHRQVSEDEPKAKLCDALHSLVLVS